MPFQKLKFRPGVVRDGTRYSSEGTWWDMDKVRFFNGYPQKIGGWVRVGTSTFLGKCRFLHNWISLEGENLLLLGTNKKAYIERGDAFYDITPIRLSVSASNPFTTSIGSTQVLVAYTGHGAVIGDYVTFSGSSAVGGVPAGDFNKEHEITSIVTANTFYITVATSASSSTSGGGTVLAEFQPNTTADVSALLGGGYGVGPYGTGGYGMASVTRYAFYLGDNFGQDLIYAIRDGGLFSWAPYPMPSALSTRGTYIKNQAGASSVPLVVDHIVVTSDEHVVVIGTNSISQINTLTNVLVSGGAPGSKTVTLNITAHGLATGDSVTIEDATAFDGLVAAEINKQHTITYLSANSVTFTVTTGCTAGSVTGGGTITIYSQEDDEDPLLVRWCSQSNYLNWTPKPTNTSGDYRLSAGSYTYSVRRMRQENLIWTDTALYSMQYVGPPQIFSFSQLADNISITSVMSVAVVENVAYWMGMDKFYLYNGNVATVPCSVSRYVFNDINLAQAAQVYAGTNTQFNEVIWFYCSTDSLYPDRYVMFNYMESTWAFGTMARTSWLDSPLHTNPVATGTDGKLYYHEAGLDDGSTSPASGITAFAESADVTLGEGDYFMFADQCLPDVDFEGSTALTPTAVLTLKARNSPGGNYGQSNNRNVAQTAVVPFNQFTDQVWVRLRGRQMSFRVESSSTGVTWRLGVPRINLREDGKR